MFVVLEGEFAVRDSDHEVSAVGPGDFVGEMAALDWGAGYGSIRAAQVEALTPGCVLVFTPAQLRAALAVGRPARELVERTARERLAAMQAGGQRTPTQGGRPR